MGAARGNRYAVFMDVEAAAAVDLASCRLCGLTQRVATPAAGYCAACSRCGTLLAEDKPNSVNRTLAFASSALILYVPANLLPIMRFEYFGAVEKNTVWSGVVTLAQSGMWFVAAVVFMASIVVPLIKLSVLFYLALSANTSRTARLKTALYRLIRAVGGWAMLDVFLLSILVAAVKLGQLANISPGPGALPFTLVVIFTILASESFDPKLIWRHEPSSRSPR